jgi:hypothetical protein
MDVLDSPEPNRITDTGILILDAVELQIGKSAGPLIDVGDEFRRHRMILRKSVHPKRPRSRQAQAGTQLMS